MNESELFYLMSKKMNENALSSDDSQTQDMSNSTPMPSKIVLFDINEVQNNGCALVHF